MTTSCVASQGRPRAGEGHATGQRYNDVRADTPFAAPSFRNRGLPEGDLGVVVQNHDRDRTEHVLPRRRNSAFRTSGPSPVRPSRSPSPSPSPPNGPSGRRRRHHIFAPQADTVEHQFATAMTAVTVVCVSSHIPHRTGSYAPAVSIGARQVLGQGGFAGSVSNAAPAPASDRHRGVRRAQQLPEPVPASFHRAKPTGSPAGQKRRWRLTIDFHDLSCSDLFCKTQVQPCADLHDLRRPSRTGVEGIWRESGCPVPEAPPTGRSAATCGSPDQRQAWVAEHPHPTGRRRDSPCGGC
jgi:hypothetical protein